MTRYRTMRSHNVVVVFRLLLGGFMLCAAACSDGADKQKAAATLPGAGDGQNPPAEDVGDTSEAPTSDTSETAPVGDTGPVAPDDTTESGDTTTVADTGEEPDTQTRAPIAATYGLTLQGWDLDVGAEDTRCVIQRLDNPTEAWVTAIRTTLGKGSHHLIVYRSEETVEKLTPFDCVPFVETLSGKTVPLMISQIAEDALVLPDGVAFKFQPKPTHG